MVPSRTANILPVNGSTLHPNLAASLSNAFRVSRPRDHLDRVNAIVAMRSVRVVAEPGSRRARRRASVQGSPPRRDDDATNARTTPHPHPEDPDAESGSASASVSVSVSVSGSLLLSLSLSSRASLGVCSSSGHRFAAAGDPQGNVAVTKTASSAVSLRCMSTAARKSATAASRSAASRSLAWSRNRTATNVATNAHTASATNHHKLWAFSRWWGWSSWACAHPVGCGEDRAREDGTSGAAVGRGERGGRRRAAEGGVEDDGTVFPGKRRARRSIDDLAEIFIYSWPTTEERGGAHLSGLVRVGGTRTRTGGGGGGDGVCHPSRAPRRERLVVVPGVRLRALGRRGHGWMLTERVPAVIIRVRDSARGSFARVRRVRDARRRARNVAASAPDETRDAECTKRAPRASRSGGRRGDAYVWTSQRVLLQMRILRAHQV
jgi:hypothetical protein